MTGLWKAYLSRFQIINYKQFYNTIETEYIVPLNEQKNNQELE